MQECKLIQALSNSKTQIHREAKAWYQIQRPMPKDWDYLRNRIWIWFPPPEEGIQIECSDEQLRNAISPRSET
jgi:hypothetical protein